MKQHVVFQKIPSDRTKNKSDNKPINGTTSQIIQLRNYNWATTSPLWPNRGGGRERWEEEKWKEERRGEKIDFMSERLPKCPGGLWLQCCTLHLFTAERKTDGWGGRDRETEGKMEGEMLPAACCHLSNVVTVPHYVLFQSSSSMHTHTNCSLILLSLSCAVKASLQRGAGKTNNKGERERESKRKWVKQRQRENECWVVFRVLNVNQFLIVCSPWQRFPLDSLCCWLVYVCAHTNFVCATVTSMVVSSEIVTCLCVYAECQMSW